MKSLRRLDKEKFERDQETNRSTFRGANQSSSQANNAKERAKQSIQ